MNRRRFLKWSLGSTVALSGLGLGYARYEASWVRLDHQTITVPRLPSAFEGKTVALLADFHHSDWVSLDYIKKVVEKTNALQADLIVLPGDFVHTSKDHRFMRPCIEALSSLHAPLGVFATPGNHDHWDDVALLHQCLHECRVIDLTNTGRWIEQDGSHLWIGGVDDLWEGKPDLRSALSEARSEDCCLLLCHNPDYVEHLRDHRVSLVFSGHTHGGQVILPFVGIRGMPSRYGKKYAAGLVKTPWTQVFVTRGLGTSSVPFRFRCRPEINLLTLTRENAPEA
jgi:predicted MPP superfamily phosphohydrolase